jgi:thiamine kinase-like enzyme
VSQAPQTDEAKLDSIIARVPVLADADDLTIGVLHGGLSNANYLVEADGDSYVVRIGCENWDLLGISRLREESAERTAVAAGISPELVAFFQPEGYSVTRFLKDAHAVPIERFTSRDMIPQICRVLHDVHALDPIDGVFDPFGDIERWAALLDSRDTPWPARLRPLLERVRETGRLRTPPDKADLVLCHNDPYHLNFLDDGSRLWLIDWEYAGMGDRMYDLAGVGSVLDGAGRDLVLENYFGTVDPAVRRDLDAMIDVFVCWNTVWCLIQIEDSTIAHDYFELAEQILDRLSPR